MNTKCWFCDELITSTWHAAKCPIREYFGGTPLSTVWPASTTTGKTSLLLTLTTITAACVATIAYFTTT